MSRILPQRPSLEHLHKQAKTLLDAMREQNPGAQLADAQFALAREYGFASWPKLKAHVESVLSGFDPVRALVEAVKAGATDQVRQLLADHPALKDRLDDPLPGLDFDGTVLLRAVSQANRDLVQVLLDAGADINQKSHWWAGGFGVLDSVEPALAPFLIERGARLEPPAAARLGMLDELKAMVARDPAAVHARGGDGHTALHEAASLEIARFLVEHGADVNAIDVDHESTPAQYLIKDHQDIVRYLISRGSRTDILMAAALGDNALVRSHLERNPESIRTTVGSRDFPMANPKAGGIVYYWTLGGGGMTPHMIAQHFGHRDTYRLLLDHTPADYQARLEHRKLPDAARAGDGDAVRRMLAQGWPLDARGDENATALHWAAWLGYAPIVRDLLEAGAPVNIRGDTFDGTPLGWAAHGSVHGWNCRTGDFAGVVRALLDAGARISDLPADFDATDAVHEIFKRSV